MNNDDVDGDDDDTETINIIATPIPPKVAYTSSMADLYIGEISNFLSDKPIEQRVISIDAEWRRGNGTNKADVFQIGLANGASYLFALFIICGNRSTPPRSLVMLLENANIKKVGNRVHNERKVMLAWGVTIKSTVELGHLSHARALTTRAPALDFLVGLLWPGIFMDKSGDSPRISDWSRYLTDEQVEYGGCDVYATMMAYLRFKRK